jgi:hypothetical protein
MTFATPSYTIKLPWHVRRYEVLPVIIPAACEYPPEPIKAFAPIVIIAVPPLYPLVAVIRLTTAVISQVQAALDKLVKYTSSPVVGAVPFSQLALIDADDPPVCFHVTEAASTLSLISDIAYSAIDTNTKKKTYFIIRFITGYPSQQRTCIL